MLLDGSCGSQTPSLALYPPGDLDFSVGDAVLDWLDALGMTLFDWQRHVLRSALGRRGKRWAAYEVDLVVPRQNGKNEILIALELAAANLLGVRLVIHSAHEAITAAKHFKRFQEFVDEDSPSFKPEVAKLFPRTKTRGFYTSNGKEHIEFANGAQIDFRTRTKSAGRGFSAPLVVLDEAFNLPPKAVGALQYTMRAKPNAQFWKTSSAAHADSSVLHNDRRRAVEADPNDSRLLYMEWGNEAGCDPASTSTWARSNPSMGMDAPGFELPEQTFHNEYASAKGDPELLAEFVREVCGVPEPPLSEQGGIMPNWSAVGEVGSAIASHHQWAIATSPDRRFTTIGVAGRREDGSHHVAVHYRRSGTDWVVADAVKFWEQYRIPVRIWKQGPEASFIPLLRERGVEVVEVTTGDVSQATGIIRDGVEAGTVWHPVHKDGQTSSLDRAVAGAELRVGPDGAAVWSQRNSSVEISPLVAVTVALGGVPQELVRPPQVWSWSLVDAGAR